MGRKKTTQQRRVPSKPTICIVGPGRLGSALALALHRAGYVISELITRRPSDLRALSRRTGANAVQVDHAELSSDIVWLTVSDSAIRSCANDLAQRDHWRGKVVFHSSGALSSDELAQLKQQGASVASVHPLMTFSGGKPPRFKNIFFALEGDDHAVRVAEAIVTSLGATPMQISPEHKAAYHAWASFASPLLIALLAIAERVGTLAGLGPEENRRALMPLIRQTLDNYAAQGASTAFTGPFVRGDVRTIRKHLEVLRSQPAVRDAYVALAKAALELLPVGNAEQIGALLERGDQPPVKPPR